MAFVALSLGSFLVSAILVTLLRSLALKWGVVDKPDTNRKIHLYPTPLLGGVAVGASILITLAIVSGMHAGFELYDSHVTISHIMGFILGMLILIIGGTLDDIYNLKPYQQALFPLCASSAVIASGIGVVAVTNPFGGTVVFTHIQSDILTFFWLMGTIYTTKFLDGLDGLCSGITSIGSLIIALLSLFVFINIPTAVLALIIAGSYAGFLLWNFHPARIFLGESGSTLAGYSLGVLAMISGAKFATALLILAIPILDASWVIVQRLLLERRSPFQGDRKHIHFRLVDSGLTHRRAVGLLYAASLLFGLSALFLQSSQKLTVLGLIAVIAVILCITYWKRTCTMRE